MEKRTLDQLAKVVFHRCFSRKIITAYAAILTLCLFFAQVAIASPGTVNYNTIYQQLEGFGGAAVYDVTSLTSHSQREAVYDLLFRDLGLDVLRIRNTYGYDDGGAYMAATKTIVAAGRQSTRNPKLKLELVPWSPAAYLKNNYSINSGTLAKSGGVYVYAAYADWWADSLEEWASGDDGLIPEYISMQNEPDYDASYDSCRFDPTENPSFPGYNTAFNAVFHEIESRLGSTISSMPMMLAPETMGFWGSINYINAFDVNHAYGFSHHLYSDGSYDSPDGMISNMENYAANYGDVYNKPLFMTEYTKNNTTPNFDMAVKMAWHIHNTLVHEGVTSFYWWTLFRAASSSTGGVINLGSGSSYTIRDLYWFLKAYTYFTDPGWYVINATTNPSTNLRMTAFRNLGNDQLTVVVLNKSTSTDSISLTLNNFSPTSSQVYRSSATEHWVSLGSYSSPLSLPPESITTIAFSIGGPHQTLTVSSTDYGTVTTPPGEGNYPYLQNTYAAITATHDLHCHFVNWTGTAVTAGKVGNPYAADTTVLMDANYTVVANFEPDPPDLFSPLPNPLTWASVPTATGSTTITMTASTAIDVNTPPVQYYFECTNHGEANSAWQASPTYMAAGLSANTQYTFRVKARDSAPALNETGWSSENSATTFNAGESVEILGVWKKGTVHAKEAGQSRALIFIAHAKRAAGVISLDSVTYGGQPMTKVIDKIVGTVPSTYVAAYILDEAGIAAATGTSFSADFGVNSPDYIGYSSVFLAGVDQTTPIGMTDSNSITGSSPTTIRTNYLSTGDSDLVIDAVSSGSSGSYTLNNSFTEGIDQATGSLTGVSGHKFATGENETPSATHTGPNGQVIIGLVVRTAAAEIPTSLTAAGGNGKVTLNWNDSNETDLAGYNVYRSTTSGSGYSKLNDSPLSDSNHIDNTVTNGTPYFYVVTALNTVNESGFSNEAAATPNYEDCNDILNAGLSLKSDLNKDCYVDYKDLKIMADYWLNNDCSAPDNCGGADFQLTDGVVNFYDFSIFADQWMKCNDPQDADCEF